MAKDWDYSNLVKDAKSQGGPEKYIEKISADGEQKGVVEGATGMAAVILGLYGAYKGIKYLYKKAKQKFSKEEVAEAKQVVIEYINSEMNNDAQLAKKENELIESSEENKEDSSDQQ